LVAAPCTISAVSALKFSLEYGSFIFLRNAVTQPKCYTAQQPITQASIGLNGKFLRFRRDGVSKPRSFFTRPELKSS
jgi:hypothetical protein